MALPSGPPSAPPSSMPPKGMPAPPPKVAAPAVGPPPPKAASLTQGAIDYLNFMSGGGPTAKGKSKAPSKSSGGGRKHIVEKLACSP